MSTTLGEPGPSHGLEAQTLSQRDRELVKRYLGNPLEFPAIFKGWLETYLDPMVRDIVSTAIDRSPPYSPAGAWRSWSPVVTQGAGAIAQSSTDAKYVKVDKLVICRATITMNGGGVGTNIINSTLPVAQLGGSESFGSAMVYDLSATTHYTGTCYAAGGSASFYRDTVGPMGVITLAVGDIIRFALAYEAA